MNQQSAVGLVLIFTSIFIFYANHYLKIEKGDIANQLLGSGTALLMFKKDERE